MLILVGPSASGKTEATKILIEKYNLKKLVTYTTRSMRVHEVNGKDYHFITKEEFINKMKEKDVYNLFINLEIYKISLLERYL